MEMGEVEPSGSASHRDAAAQKQAERAKRLPPGTPVC